MCEVFLISIFFLSLFLSWPVSLSFYAINTTSNNKSLHQVWYRLMRAHTQRASRIATTNTIQNRISCLFDTHIVLYHFNWYCIKNRGLLTAVSPSACACAYVYIYKTRPSLSFTTREFEQHWEVTKKMVWLLVLSEHDACVFIIVTPLACAARFNQNTNLSINNQTNLLFAVFFFY